MDDDDVIELHKLKVENYSHIQGSLLSHLEGTSALLIKWGNREALCKAGLYHSIYGTQGFQKQATNDRVKIINIIGDEAEKIVFYFSTCDRSHFYPQIGNSELIHRNYLTGETELLDESLIRDLLELTLANELEILMRISPKIPEKWKILFQKFEKYVSIYGFKEFKEYEFNLSAL